MRWNCGSHCGSTALLSDFEKIIDGGLRENTIYLIRGLPGSGKTSFCVTLLGELLEKGEECVYLTTELSPKDLMKHTKNGFGLDFERYVREGKLLFLDACSWKTGKSGPEVLDVSNLMTVSHELSVLLDEVSSNKRKRFFLFFDSITSLLLYNPVEGVVKFLQVLVERMRMACENGVPGIFTVETGIHDKTTVNMASFFMDSIFETRKLPVAEDIIRQFRVMTLKSARHETRWLPIKIDKSGFGFVEGSNRTLVAGADGESD